MSIYNAPTHDFDIPRPPMNPKVSIRDFRNARHAAGNLGRFASKKPIWRYDWMEKSWQPIGVQYASGKRFYIGEGIQSQQ